MSFTEKIDIIEMLHNIIQEHEDKLASLVNQIENIHYIRHRASLSPGWVTPGELPRSDNSQGSRRGGGV